MVPQKSVDAAFEQGIATNVEVVGAADHQWYFTVQMPDPLTGKPARFAIERQRGNLRVWSDLDLLLKFLSRRYRVDRGTFVLQWSTKA